MEILKKWKIHDSLYNKLSSVYDQFKLPSMGEFYIMNITKFNSKLNQDLKIKLEQELITKGFIFFLGSSILSLIYYNEIKNIESLFSLSILYVIGDSYVDDSKDKNTKRLNILNALKNNSRTNKSRTNKSINTDPCDNKIKIMLEIYNDIISKFDIKEILDKLIFDEIKHSINQNKDQNFKELYEIAVNKGHNTLELISKLLNIDIDDNIKNIGAVLQLIDDMIDFEEDMKNNITTQVTILISNNILLDEYVISIINIIESIDVKFNVSKIFCYQIIIYFVNKYPHFFNYKIQKKTNYLNYSLFDIVEDFFGLKNLYI